MTKYPETKATLERREVFMAYSFWGIESIIMGKALWHEQSIDHMSFPCRKQRAKKWGQPTKPQIPLPQPQWCLFSSKAPPSKGSITLSNSCTNWWSSVLSTWACDGHFSFSWPQSWSTKFSPTLGHIQPLLIQIFSPPHPVSFCPAGTPITNMLSPCSWVVTHGLTLDILSLFYRPNHFHWSPVC